VATNCLFSSAESLFSYVNNPQKKYKNSPQQTDASQYTGSHQHRFDADGKGRGLAGRDRVAKGGVNPGDLGNLLDRSDADVRGVKK
jgi:hypothetical protein